MKVDRYVLGEGYGLGRGILSDGENKGAFAWVGLSAEPRVTIPMPLTFPTTSPVVNGTCVHPETRRKFRLVLEVIEDPTSRVPGCTAQESAHVQEASRLRMERRLGVSPDRRVGGVESPANGQE